MPLFPVFKTTFRILLGGPSCCGKSSFFRNLILQRKELIEETGIPDIFDGIFIVFRSWQPLYEELQQEVSIPIHFLRQAEFNDTNSEENKSLLSLQDWIQKANAKCSLLIFDDALQLNSSDVVDWFSRLSHHLNTSVIFICQNIFDRKNTILRTLSLNATHIVLFKNPRDAGIISHLAYQMYPRSEKAKKVIQAFEDATKAGYSYLLLDYTQEGNDQLRLKANLFGENGNPFIVIYDVN